MTASKRRSKHSPIASSESESDACLASKRRTMRQRDEDKLLPDGFLDPLQPLKSNKNPEISRQLLKSEKNPEISRNANELDYDDVKKRFLLKLLQDHNKPKWRTNVGWVKEAWDKIFQAFNQKFLDDNVTRTQLQDRVYRMKKIYKDLKQLSELSDLKWDHRKNMLQGTEEIWQKLQLTSKDAKKWYNQPWPYYSSCQKLFAEKLVNEKQSTQTDESCEGAQDVKLSKKNMSSPQSSFSPLHTSKKAQHKILSQEFLGTKFENLKGKNDQCCESIRLAHDEINFSIKNCIENFYKLNGFTTADLFKVGRIFKIKENREIFLSLIEEDREF